jgi:hypothetical protein
LFDNRRSKYRSHTCVNRIATLFQKTQAGFRYQRVTGAHGSALSHDQRLEGGAFRQIGEKDGRDQKDRKEGKDSRTQHEYASSSTVVSLLP